MTTTIGNCPIGAGHRPFIIAELSGNHKGDINRALHLIEVAKECGASAVKLQTYTADTMTIEHHGPDFQIEEGPWQGRNLYDLYREAHTPWDWHAELFACARKIGIQIFSTPFDASAVAFLAELNVPAYKIASFELVDLPLVRHVASQGKPVIMSTGLANLGEIEKAVGAARSQNNDNLILLHCVSSYPAPQVDSNLLTIPHLGETFSVPTGLSDHTEGTAVSVAAIALGACVIEKHLTLARADGGPDAAFSLEPHEFRRLVQDCNSAWLARGRISYSVEGSERGNLVFRRSLYVVKNIAAGEQFDETNVRAIRPGYGMDPDAYGRIVGCRARRSINRGTPLHESLIDFGMRETRG